MEEGGDEVMSMMKELGILVKSEPKHWKPERTMALKKRALAIWLG